MSTRIGIVMVLCSATLVAQRPAAGTATDPILGNWSLNLKRSTFSPGSAPEPGTLSLRRYTLRPDGFMVTLFVTVSPEGEPAFVQVTWKYDGADYPSYASNSLADFSVTGVSPGTMAYRSTDAHTTDMMPKENGKVSFTGIRRRVVSSDGQTLIDISRGTNAQGEKVDNVLIFDRCKAPCFQSSAF